MYLDLGCKSGYTYDILFAPHVGVTPTETRRGALGRGAEGFTQLSPRVALAEGVDCRKAEGEKWGAMLGPVCSFQEKVTVPVGIFTLFIDWFTRMF